ncbi:MAG: carboxypeptidase regulatory-like domain-containing protein [Vicinamibacterales bacterium]
MRRLAVRFSLALALVALAAAYAPAWAQIETGRISGTVADTSGGVVPGVTVTAKSVNTGFTRETVSDTDGKYVIANVTPDTYEVTFMLTGFKPVGRRVTVSVGSEVAADVRLEVGAVTEAITVTAVQEAIDTRTGEFKTTVNARQIIELPTLTRNPYDLVALAGNVREVSPDELTLVGGGGRGTGFSINGQRSSSTNILLDGGDNNYLFVASIGQEVPLDAVQEFSVVTNNFSAQYGRATGGIVNVVTKSGTNRFSGSAYEFFRNDELSNNSPDNEDKELPKGNFRRNQPGYSLGGPLVRDKVHFFSSLEYIGIRSTDTLSSWVVTPQFLAASAPVTQSYFSRYGVGVSPTGPVLTRGDVTTALGIAGTGAFNSLPASLPVFQRADVPIATDAGGGFPGDTYQTINKIDFALGVNNRASIAYSYLKGDNEAGTQSSSPYPMYNTPTLERKHNINGSLTRVWSNNFTSQSRLVWNKISEDQPINGDPEPALYMNSQTAVLLSGDPIAFPGYFPFNPGVSIPAGGPQKLFQFYQDQTWLKGSHDVRFGGAFVRVMDDHTFGAFSNALQFLNITTNNTNSLNNLVTGQIGRFQKAINPDGFPGETYVTPVAEPSFLSKNRYNEVAFYANDNWSVGNRLKLNLGVRYEYFGPQKKSDPKYDSNFYWADTDFNLTEATPQQTFAQLRGGAAFPTNESPIGSLWKADKNNFAPRLGFAWDVNGDGQTAVRGGYGIAYERNFGNVTYNVLFNPPLYVLATLDALQPINTENLGPFGGAAGTVRTIPVAQLRHIDQNIETAYSHLYGISLTKALGTTFTGGIEYNGSSGRKLYDLADVNRAGAPAAYEGVPAGVNCVANPVQGPCLARPNTQYSSFGTRSNRGESQYHGVVFSLDTNQLGRTGVALTSRYTLSRAKDNLSSTFTDSDNMRFIVGSGYLDPWNPMLDYGYASFDVRHRLSASAIWSVPFGGNNVWLGGWQVNGLFSARSGYPFSVGDCDNGFFICMRALDPTGIDRNADGDTPTGEPNEYILLDLTPLVPAAGTYVHPVQGTSDFGPYPDSLTKRNDFRGPGTWNVDLSFGKRFRFGSKAALARIEFYNIFNHHNMYTNTESAFVTSAPGTDNRVTGFKDDFRRIQLGFKFEF